MNLNSYTVQVISPSDGYTLTQVADVDIESRILSKKIFLAVNDYAENYKEITDAEADEIRAEQERVAKEKAEAEKAENVQ